jgi:coenzyme F420 hydrogenase subunit beta
MKDIGEVIKTGLCLGCGVCAFLDSIEKMTFSKRHDHNIPVLNDKNYKNKLAFEICPGKGYNIVEESENLYNQAQYDLELGYIYNQYAAFSNDKEIMKSASSGGIMSQIANYLLEKKIVDRVLTSQFKFNSGVSTVCILAKNKTEILQSQGSKYCPVDLAEAIREIKYQNYRVAIIGTPCQIAGIRSIQRNDKEFSQKVIITIGNFCGGIKKFKNINLIAKRKGINPKKIDFFRFRGNGQPGSMLIKENSGKMVEIPYPKYVGLNGLSKHLRCHLCVDATGELADIACGDAWLPRFIQDINPWSIIITRNRIVDELIRKMKETNIITTQNISLKEIRASQFENLTSKKVRQKSRFYLYGMLGFTLPSFDGGYYDNKIRVWTEIKVFTKHKMKYLLEKMYLFSIVYKLLKK